jgi:hypothetical protein
MFADAKNSTELVLATVRGHLTVTRIWGLIESHYPIRVCAESEKFGDKVWFLVDGSTVGYVPVILCGLSTHSVADRMGLWVQYTGDAEYALVDQSYYDDSDFWQTNFDATTGTYELVFNLEIQGPDSTRLAWGFNPNTATFYPTPDPTPEIVPSQRPTFPPPTRKPSLAPTPQPSLAPSPHPSLPPSGLPTTPPTTGQTVTVAVAFVLVAATAPSAADKVTLKTTVASLVGVSEASVKRFQVSYTAVRRRLGEAAGDLGAGRSAAVASSPPTTVAGSSNATAAGLAAGVAAVARRILAASFEWSTSFEVVTELVDVSPASTSAWDSAVSSSLATVVAAASEALHLNVTVRGSIPFL